MKSVYTTLVVYDEVGLTMPSAERTQRFRSLRSGKRYYI